MIENDSNDKEFRTEIHTNRFEKQLWEEYVDYSQMADDAYNRAERLHMNALDARRKFWREVKGRNPNDSDVVHEMKHNSDRGIVQWTESADNGREKLEDELRLAEAEAVRYRNKLKRLQGVIA